MRRHVFALLSAVAAAAIAPAVALSPAVAAEPARNPVSAVSSAESCTVTGGTLTWGFKESFRSYISGTIANGSWEAQAPATYTTPEFSWPATSGEFDPATSTGEAHFSGSIRFTGHDGLLDTTIADPTLVFADGSAQLLLDVTGLSMDDALAGDTDNVQTAEQVPFVDLDLATVPLTVGETAVSATAVPTAITADGYAQFGSYEPGTAFDPVAFAFDLECAAAETPTPTPVAIETAATAAPVDASDAAASVPAWLPWTIVAVVVVAGVVVAVVMVRRRAGAGGPREGGDRS